MRTCSVRNLKSSLNSPGDLNHIWERKFPFKALIAILWDLQPLWPSSLMKPALLRFRCSSGHVLSETKSVTPNFFYISDTTNSSSLHSKSMLENFHVNVLKGQYQGYPRDFLTAQRFKCDKPKDYQTHFEMHSDQKFPQHI